MRITAYIIALVFLLGCQSNDEQKKNPYVAVESIDTTAVSDQEVKYKLGADGLTGTINKSMYIPFIAQQYGVDATVSMELTIDTSGAVVSVRKLNEQMKVISAVKKAYPKIENRLKGLFAIEAERICWTSNKMWIPAIKNGEKQISTIELTFDFKTHQAIENKTNLKKGTPLKFGMFTEGKEDLSPQLFYQIGTGLMAEKYYHQATRFFNATTYLNDTYTDAYFNAGLAYKALNNMGKACENWTKAALLGDNEAKTLVSTACR